MSFIRPEVQDRLWQWREAVAGTGTAIVGVWFAVQGRGILAVLGILMVVVGVALIFAGRQRARFRRGREGAGVVYVTEGQITYYGPVTGGAVAIASIYELILNPLPAEGPVWEVRAPNRPPIRIPVNAGGAEALFDVYSGLEGLNTEEMMAKLDAPGHAPNVIWTRRLLH